MSRTQLALYLAAFVLATIVVFTLVLFSFFSKSSSPPVISVSPLPSSYARGIPANSLPPQVIDTVGVSKHPNNNTPQQTMTEVSEKLVTQDQQVGQLIKKLPFHSELFVLRYDIETNSFVVSFIKDKLNEANQSFDQFLKDNSIENRNWLYNLNIKNQTY